MRWVPLFGRTAKGERPLEAVPRWVFGLLAGSLCLHIAWQALLPRPVAEARALAAPPTPAALRVLALGEPIALAQSLTLYLQAFDNQPGISIPFLQLDYSIVQRWLAAILALDPAGHYPLLMASHLYGMVPDQPRQRAMCEFVRQQFHRDPDRRWRWLAHCAIAAKHRMEDPQLALSYAEAITREARHASGWARQMRIFILEDLGETEAARVLLGGLLESGEVKDPKEIHFLAERLKGLKGVEKPTASSDIRR